MERWIARAVQFDVSGALSVEYIDTTRDFRTNGLVQNHVIFVPKGSDYDNEIEDIEEAVKALLKDITEDLALVEAVQPKEDE